MNLIVDANIILAAMLSDGTTRELLLYRTPIPLRLFTPPFLLQEIAKYKRYLSKKTGRSESEVIEAVMNLLSAASVGVINSREINLWLSEGLRISPDPDDAMYFAAALSKRCKIWSNDRRLKRQKKVEIIATAELLKII